MPELAFLLDANMPRSSAKPLESAGHKVDDVRDIGLGDATDAEIIEHARATDSIVVTRDTDFGSVLRYPNHPGALILRLPHTYRSQEINGRLEEFLGVVDDEALENAIVVLERNRYRRRPID